MAENPRDYIRAAQAAELRGDRAGAADLLHRAAAVYARSGNRERALHLLRRARSLDGSRQDIAAAVQQLEYQSGASAEAQTPGEPSEEVADLPATGELLAEQQRLIEEALRAVDSGGGADSDDDALKTWHVEVLSPDDLPKALDWAVRNVPDLPPAKNEWSLDDVVDAELRLTPMEDPLSEEDADSFMDEAGDKAHLFERGPTRADPSNDAWCSFCCRPRKDAGELVAGPAGAFICRACVGEADGLLGDVKPMPRPVLVRPVREEPPRPMGLIGQEEARALLERALEGGVRRVLLLGPEGVGKTTWLQALQGQGRGVLVTMDTLDDAPRSGVLLIEDVDRLTQDGHSALTAFLARQPERTVLMTARGALTDSSVVLRNGETRLPLCTTAMLDKAVGGTVPVALLEQVQLAVPLLVPAKKDFMEMARRGLARRTPAVSVTEDILTTLAAEALRSPRAGHELQALLARVPAGTWKLEAAKAKATPRAKAKKPARRVRRKEPT